MDEYQINEERGEVPITLAGKVYPMRPSRAAMKAIETATGRSIENLLFRSAERVKSEDGRIREGLLLSELETIVTEGVRAAGAERQDQMLRAFDREQVGERLFESGFLAYYAVVEKFLVNAISGGADPKRKKAARAGESPATESAQTAP